MKPMLFHACLAVKLTSTRVPGPRLSSIVDPTDPIFLLVDICIRCFVLEISIALPTAGWSSQSILCNTSLPKKDGRPGAAVPTEQLLLCFIWDLVCSVVFP